MSRERFGTGTIYFRHVVGPLIKSEDAVVFQSVR